MLAEIPKYEEYELVDLYRVLNSLRGDLYPHILDALEQEIAGRESSSVVELEDCYYVLDKANHPEHAERLLARIDSMGGFSVEQPFQVTAENKYRTFWLRFFAQIADGFVTAIPLSLVLFVIQNIDMFPTAVATYANQAGQLIIIVYFIVMHAKYGQTVGKMALKVKVIDKSETRDISFLQAVLRDIVPAVVSISSLVYFVAFGTPDSDANLDEPGILLLYAIALVTLAWWILEFVTMLFNKKRRALHDYIAGTVVTRLP